MSERKGWQVEGFLETVDGRLTIDGVSANDLAREHGTPLFVFSEKRIRHNIDRLKKAGDAVPCPLKICYAAKAMSTMGVLRAVKDTGIDIEVNSGGELWKALKVGFTGSQIIFNGTSKEVWELEMAIENSIYAIQVDSLYELSLIQETAKRLGKRANVSLRLVPEIESGTHSGLQTALLTSKFGMMPDEAVEAFKEYKDSPHVDLCGIHLHVGSQNPDPKVYGEALAALFNEMQRITAESGVHINHINIGGGFPVDYLNEEAPDFPPSENEMLGAGYSPESALKEAWNDIGNRYPKEMFYDLTILIEPGRSIIADAGICLTTVRNAKQRPTDHLEQTADHWLLTDAGFNLLLSMETYKWYYHLVSAGRAGEEHNFAYKLAGPLCDGGDVYFDLEGERLPPHRLLPEAVGPGEVLALLNCGAYSLAQASQYNGRALPPVVLVRTEGTPELIRRRDTFEDLVTSDL